MVEIETFLRSSTGEFTEVDACRTAPTDLDYIEGAIRLSVDGRVVVGLEEWDYVDQLWCYLADMVTQLPASGHAETYFPDQPIKLSFDTAGPRTLVTCTIGDEVKRASTATTELLNSIKTAGLLFFDKMSQLAPANSYTEARQQLSA